MVFYHNNRKVTNMSSVKKIQGVGQGGVLGCSSWNVIQGAPENKPVESRRTVAQGPSGCSHTDQSQEKSGFVRNRAKQG